ncbi:putative Phospholipase A2 inhibitor alfa-like protein [Naja naja]|nr:putative Phospholipase A2 inhibitor alfa-like protein [Naja naja]
MTNKKVGKFEDLRNTCTKASGQIPSPQLQKENKAFANVLERQNRRAYLVIHDSPTFTNWAEGELNNVGGTKECVVADAQGAWRSESCEEDLLVKEDQHPVLKRGAADDITSRKPPYHDVKT